MIEGALHFLAENWYHILSAIIILQAISVGLAVLSERREPSATLAWLMTVTFLPLLGIIAYYALARTRFRRQFRSKVAANRQADEALLMYVHERLGDIDADILRGVGPAEEDLMELAANSEQFRSGGPPFSGNSVELYFEPARKYDALKEAIRSARSHIHIEYYRFRGDGIGAELRDLLIERVKAGVEVRVLCDGIGSLHANRADFFRPLVDAGGEFAVFLPLRFAKIIERVNFRDHRKIAVIDGRTGFIGGMNIGDEHLGLDPEAGKWHDAHLRIDGPAVAELQRVFLIDWLFTTDRRVAEPKYFPRVPPTGDETVQVVSSGPDRRWPTILQLYFQAVAMASRQVFISSPYFIPDRSLLMALETAALRGVDVRLLLPHNPDGRIVAAAAHSYYEEVLEAGIRIFEYLPGFMHSKMITVDGRYGSVGSANMDVRSFGLNFEVSAFVYSRAFARRLRLQFERDLEQSIEIELDAFRQRSRVRKFGQSVAHLLSGIL
jgi:cardiolipin synthase